MAGLCEGGNEPPGSLKVSTRPNLRNKNGLTMSIGWTAPESQDEFSAINHMEDDLWDAPEKMDGDRNRPLGIIPPRTTMMMMMMLMIRCL
ncbi:hypothetical protein ANN_07626 [Periplaneta americana]|uniref:Uncharacterized protein n=1 Tax=Periplaneta americana TaxID=6978 RepID=A0ABQ8T0Q7_PERAM|nr:hypothetical protein ANN_07626 [Periplaneta americana]